MPTDRFAHLRSHLASRSRENCHPLLICSKHSQQTFQKQKWNLPVPCKEGKACLENTAIISFVLRRTHSNVVIELLDIKKHLARYQNTPNARTPSFSRHFVGGIPNMKFLLPNLTDENPPPQRSSNSNLPPVVSSSEAPIPPNISLLC